MTMPNADSASDSPQVFEARAAAFARQFADLQRALETVFVGQRNVVEELLLCFFCGGHALIEGAPGLGKTVLVRTLADALHLRFARVQCTPDLMPADVTGTNIVSEGASGQREFRFEPGPIFANLVLADEINRATPRTQAAFLEAMQEHRVTVFGTTHVLDEPFTVCATQNPIEMEGTYPLPEAQLDRFFFKLRVGVPTMDDLREIMARTTGTAAPKSGATLRVAPPTSGRCPPPSGRSRSPTRRSVWRSASCAPRTPTPTMRPRA
jgi:MoxR-like ATPase